MKVALLLISLVYMAQPVKIIPVNLRACADYINFDANIRMFYVDSSGTKLYYKDVTSFNVIGRWVMDADLTVGSANLFIGL